MILAPDMVEPTQTGEDVDHLTEAMVLEILEEVVIPLGEVVMDHLLAVEVVHPLVEEEAAEEVMDLLVQLEEVEVLPVVEIPVVVVVDQKVHDLLRHFLLHQRVDHFHR